MATNDFTDDRIDELGARLRRGIAVADRDAYQPYLQYLTRLRWALEGELRHLNPGAEVGSRTKRVETVAAKLRRRPELNLSQVTDLAGCRVILPNREAQAAVVSRLRRVYDVQEVDDKSDSPKSGYRAVHLDIRYRGQLMEIQVQTRNQHLWQRVSELAAGQDIAIKYGGGHPRVARALLELSELAYRCDLEGRDLPDAAIAETEAVIESVYSGSPG